MGTAVKQCSALRARLPAQPVPMETQPERVAGLPGPPSWAQLGPFLPLARGVLKTMAFSVCTLAAPWVCGLASVSGRRRAASVVSKPLVGSAGWPGPLCCRHVPTPASQMQLQLSPVAGHPMWHRWWFSSVCY